MLYTHSWFKFRNKFSYEYNILVEEQAEIVKAQKSIEGIEIVGRSRKLFLDNDSYEPYTKSVLCSIFDIKKLDEIVSWLDGEGELIFSNEPDKYYNAYILNQISFSKVGLFFDYKRFPLSFEVEAFKYFVNKDSDKLVISENNFSFYSKGTYYARPVLDIYANGDIELWVNGNLIKIKAVDEFVRIDSDNYLCHKNGINFSDKMEGAYPIFNLDKNHISYAGAVNKIEVTPNWRCL